MGDALTALDLYWAAFAAMVEPLPDDLCKMPAYVRAVYELREPEVRAAADPAREDRACGFEDFVRGRGTRDAHGVAGEKFVRHDRCSVSVPGGIARVLGSARRSAAVRGSPCSELESEGRLAE